MITNPRPRSRVSGASPSPATGATHRRGVGTVKWFDVKKGYGFIVASNGEEILVHHSVIRGSGFRFLRHQETVRFTAQRGQRGWLATSVVCPVRQAADTMDC